MIYFWDMDFTIVNNDCDVSWKKFLVSKGLAPRSELEKVDFFYRQYLDKKLDINKFIKFQLSEFTRYSKEQIIQLCQEHFDQIIKPKIYAQAQEMIQEQLQNKDRVCLITATNNYIAQPLANYLGLQYIKATKVEEKKGKFTGNFISPYCCGEKKIFYMKQLVQELGLKDNTPTTYYGDSVNDIALFHQVDKACVINPSGELLEQAKKNNWQTYSFV